MIRIPKFVKKPQTIKLIKQKSWWEYDKEKYYSGMFRDKHCIYSFFDNSHAENCMRHLNNDSFISTEPFESIKNRCLVNGIGLIGITYFGNKISAVDLLEHEKVEIHKVLNNLEILYHLEEDFD